MVERGKKVSGLRKTPPRKGVGQGVGGGRPPVQIDMQAVERAASIGCTADEIAVLLGVGRSTFFEKLNKDPALKESLEIGKARGRTTLRRLQWQGAETGNPTMLIWLGKQLLDQRDKVSQEHSGPGGGPIQNEDVRAPIASFMLEFSEPAPE